jgi:hypothetical protein
MRKKHFVICILASFLFGCHSESKRGLAPEIAIDPTQDATIVFSDFFSEGEIIRIETDTCIVSNIWRIMAVDSTEEQYFLGATANGYKCHWLNSSTGELRGIVRRGGGPNECNRITSIFSDGNGFIYLYDDMLSKLFRFSVNGELVETKRLELMGRDAQFLNEKLLVSYTEYNETRDGAKVFIINSGNGNVEQTFLKHLKPEVVNERIFSCATNLYRHNDTVCLFEPFSDTVYSISHDNVSPRFIFNAGRHRIPEGLYGNPNVKLADFVKRCESSDYVWYINRFFETRNHVIFTFMYGKKRHLAIYSKVNHRCFSSSSLFDNLATHIEEEEIPYYFAPVGATDNCVFFVVEPFHLIENIERMKQSNPDVYSKLMGGTTPIAYVYQTISNKSNPIIIRYRFK